MVNDVDRYNSFAAKLKYDVPALLYNLQKSLSFVIFQFPLTNSPFIAIPPPQSILEFVVKRPDIVPPVFGK